MSNARPNAGFSLIEVTLALGIAAVALVGIFALLPIGLQTHRNAVEQTSSTDIMSAVVSDLRATPASSPAGAAATSSRFGIVIPGNPVSAKTESTLYFSPEGQASSTIAANSRYRFTITFLPNGPSLRAATIAHMKMTWPAVVDPAKSAGEAAVITAFDRN